MMVVLRRGCGSGRGGRRSWRRGASGGESGTDHEQTGGGQERDRLHNIFLVVKCATLRRAARRVLYSAADGGPIRLTLIARNPAPPKACIVRRAVATALVGLSLLASLVACQSAPDAALPGTLERDRIELSADATETITGISVHEGQRVQRGDLLLTQDQTIAADQLSQFNAATAQAQAQLDEQRRGARGTTILAAQARRDRARVQRDDEVRERERLKGLIAQNLVSRESVDRRTAAAAAAQAALNEAESSLLELRQGTRREQIAQAQQVLEQARARQRELSTTNSRLEVRSPVNASVDALPYRVGEKPQRGATVVILLGTGLPYARIHVPEPLRLRVRIGTAALVKLDGAAATYKGHVRYIATAPEFTPYYSLTETDRSQLSYVAEVALDERSAEALPAGIPLTVQLTLDPSA